MPPFTQEEYSQYKDIINKSIFNNPIFVADLFIQLYFGGEPLTEIPLKEVQEMIRKESEESGSFFVFSN